MDFDVKVIEEIDNVNKKMSELEIEVTANGDNILRFLGEAKSGITAARNHFIQRMQFVKGVN